ncbi:MAG: bifunctional riboflavin kinase/FAD synthetase [Candidatus Pacebacteria bacterium]|nr:bifunctional riboflavin kinase/FAD synthetase [Candidatus Paceibacterota bacterium]
MKLFRDIAPTTAHHSLQNYRQSVVVLGNFDGLHQGHQAVIARARDLADAQNRKLLVVSFEPHPRRVLSPTTPPEFRLMTLRQKSTNLGQIGVDALIALRFDRAFAALSPEQFIQTILVEGLAAATVVVGHDFCFGAKRQGTVATLLARPEFATVEIIPQKSPDQILFSSTAVREALTIGDCQTVRKILGRDWAITDRVQHGDQRGRTIGFATANLPIRRVMIPRFGVYAVRAKLAAESESIPGVANIGVRPTVGGTAPRLEVHLFNFNRDIYGKRLTVELCDFIRPEQKFTSFDELKEQIARDSVTAQKYHQASPLSA